MVYATPPQMGNTNYMVAGQFSNVQQWSDAGKTSSDQAVQTIQNVDPGSVVVDMSRDGGNRVVKVHIRDRNGHMKTVRFDHEQHITQTDDGDC